MGKSRHHNHSNSNTNRRLERYERHERLDDEVVQPPHDEDGGEEEDADDLEREELAIRAKPTADIRLWEFGQNDPKRLELVLAMLRDMF